MDNIEIAQILNQVADILELSAKGGSASGGKNKNHFKISAYRRAAQVIEAMPQDINVVYKEEKLDEIPGVGESIAGKIKDLIETGRSEEIEKIKKAVPEGLLKLMDIEGLGPKKVKFIYQKFGVTSIPELKKLVKSHRLLKHKGWGEKSEENILRGIELYHRFSSRFLLGKVYFLAENILEKLRNSKLVDQAEICGSIRRKKETIGDLDILITSKYPQKAIDFFVNLPLIQSVQAKGPTKVRVILKRGPEADLRVVKPESFGAALHYFTGSKAHNIHIRRMGMERGLKINEYGIYKISARGGSAFGGKNQSASRRTKIKKLIKIGGEREEDVFKAVGLPWMPPEIREDEGEIEAALEGKLPKLITSKDIRGDLHMHSSWSDGLNSILEMAEAAKKKHYEYIAITDHTPTVGITGGLKPERILEQIKAIKELNKKISGIKILSGIEVDIKKDGSLDTPNEILKKLDIVVAAIHTAFRLPKEEMTKRMMKAMENPYVKIIAHPTGRIINEREPYELDLDKIMQKAKETNTALEINSFWNRLDLSAPNARLAKNYGVKIAISTDAHNALELDIIQFGIATARRGWLEKKDIINAWPLEKMFTFLKK